MSCKESIEPVRNERLLSQEIKLKPRSRHLSPRSFACDTAACSNVFNVSPGTGHDDWMVLKHERNWTKRTGRMEYSTTKP